jgi:two-component system, NtrC family, sensor kinase
MRLLKLFIGLLLFLPASGQNVETDSLKKELAQTPDEKKRIYILEGLSYAYVSTSPDTALNYALEGLELAKKNNDIRGQAFCTNALGNVYFSVGDYPSSLQFYFESLHLKQQLKNQNYAVTYFNIANVYTEQEDYRNALVYLFMAMQSDQSAKDSSGVLFDLYSLSSIYLRMNEHDSALYYGTTALSLGTAEDDRNLIGAILNNFGEIYAAKKDPRLALKYYLQSIPYADSIKDNQVLSSDYLGLAKIYQQKSKMDSAMHYAKKSLAIAEAAPFLKQVFQTADFLTESYKSEKIFDSAFKYQQISIAARDSLFNIEKVKKVQNLRLQEQQRQQAIEAASVRFRSRVKLYSVIILSGVFLVIAILLWRNNRQRKKSYEELEQQKIMTDRAYEELKSAQAQLIQSEKMASLGELTAGIAHEIQNPLNFVNNFSELNNELLDEMKSEIKMGHSIGAISLAENVQANLEKVLIHGRRADAIVKGMLQHSRGSSGHTETTDINALAEEYLRLAYHGFRAKDKGFFSRTETEFDRTIGEVKIIPEQVGRVIMNLANNAFYAVNEKRKENLMHYDPIVKIKTKNLGEHIEICITDNGIGISEKNMDKIFQPFFTTKPPGQGTGLGLSLSYDIIIKGHGGQLKVGSKKGEGTEFIILLPTHRIANSAVPD